MPTPLNLDEATAVLARTPWVLSALLDELPDPWIEADEGADSWSPFDVVGHLIHGEKTDWLPRARVLLEHGEDRPFEPFDRFAMLEASRGKTLAEQLAEFAELRQRNLEELAALELTEEDLDRRGVHPELGTVTLEQLLATWVVHDLGHLAQVARVMAKRCSTSVGPWREYLPILG